MTNNENSINDEFNEIIVDILRELYGYYGNEDMSSTLETTLFFDEQQRVIKGENLLIDGFPKVPPFELFEKINIISTQINLFPEKFKLASCKFSVQAGGHMDIEPIYRQN